MLRLAVDNAAPGDGAELRRKQLGKVHIAKKALGIADDDYRVLVKRVTGQASAGDCDRRQLDALLAELGRMGFRTTASRAPAAGVVARKARALWISLHQLGAIDDASEAALEAFGRRQLKVDRLNWMNDREGFRLIEALKAIATRHGWDQRIPARTSQRAAIRLLKDRLVGAQIARLATAGVPVVGILAEDRAEWSEATLEGAARQLAPSVRGIGAA